MKCHPPDNPTLDKLPLPEKRKLERPTAGGWLTRRRGDRVHLFLLEQDNSTASINLINYFI